MRVEAGAGGASGQAGRRGARAFLLTAAAAAFLFFLFFWLGPVAGMQDLSSRGRSPAPSEAWKAEREDGV